MVQAIRALADLKRRGGSIEATCRKCRRVAFFAVTELLWHFRRKQWTQEWPSFAFKLRCTSCDSKFPEVAWVETVSPPADNPPSRSYQAREPQMPVPLGVDRKQ